MVALSNSAQRTLPSFSEVDCGWARCQQHNLLRAFEKLISIELNLFPTRLTFSLWAS